MDQVTAHYLHRAIDLARRGPLADPNPQVGCVLVRGDQVIGEGWHEGAGSPHAEVAALRAAGDARDATAYVSLEPCNHTGRTGPCAQALNDAGVAKVVYAQADPNATAAGGAARLRAAGIEVEHQPIETDLNRYWTYAVTHRRPFVTWKFAATLDGRSAAADGSSQWITGPAARADVQARRATAGAIIAGTGTVLADDPRLTVRGHDGNPLRVIVGHREIPPAARVKADENYLQIPTHDPLVVLHALQDREIRHAWLEGGPQVAAAFLRGGLVDEVVAYLAPALLGKGASAVGDLGIGNIAEIQRFELHEVDRVGGDVRIILSGKGV
ncbi:riboflavin biosynthesis protein RibD [Branchiibius sp. NY16-3462-2]|nr:riboflavin biosynthesis protein RibD [Branchiibius sp. NY16-3462-2]